jgi:hypothetical protein
MRAANSLPQAPAWCGFPLQTGHGVTMEETGFNWMPQGISSSTRQTAFSGPRTMLAWPSYAPSSTRMICNSAEVNYISATSRCSIRAPLSFSLPQKSANSAIAQIVSTGNSLATRQPSFSKPPEPRTGKPHGRSQRPLGPVRSPSLTVARNDLNSCVNCCRASPAGRTMSIVSARSKIRTCRLGASVNNDFGSGRL